MPILSRHDGTHGFQKISARDGVDLGEASETVMRVAKVPFVASSDARTSGTAIFSWANPAAAEILVHEVILDITTEATAALDDVDVGVAADAGTSAADIFDSADLGTAAAILSSLTATTGGGGPVKAASGEYINAYSAGGGTSDDASGLVGNAYIRYSLV